MIAERQGKATDHNRMTCCLHRRKGEALPFKRNVQ